MIFHNEKGGIKVKIGLKNIKIQKFGEQNCQL